MKPFTMAYDYVHPNGTRYHGLIEADTRAELREHMQAEMDASEGALTPETFIVPGGGPPLEKKRAPFVPMSKLDEANQRLRAAGLPEVPTAKEAPIEVTK